MVAAAILQHQSFPLQAAECASHGCMLRVADIAIVRDVKNDCRQCECVTPAAPIKDCQHCALDAPQALTHKCYNMVILARLAILDTPDLRGRALVHHDCYDQSS